MFYLLGKDTHGQKKSMFWGFDSHRVLKGELGCMTDDQPALRTHVKLHIVDCSGEVTALCKLEDVFLLSEADAELLRGVRTLDARLNMFTTPGLLAEVRSLEDGTAVTVQHARGGKYDGFIRWHGQHGEKPGILFGVELLRPVRCHQSAVRRIQTRFRGYCKTEHRFTGDKNHFTHTMTNLPLHSLFRLPSVLLHSSHPPPPQPKTNRRIEIEFV